MRENMDKSFRLLEINERFAKGEAINKEKMIADFNIPEKTFQRDISSLRQYYSEQGIGDLLYDRKSDCYRLKASPNKLSKEEVFAICKILIESRAFNKVEFESIITKLLHHCEIEEAKVVKCVISNERGNYIPLKHGKPIINSLWQLATAVIEQRIIEIEYKRLDDTTRFHEVKPVGIMFSEFYFYLIAYMADDSKEYPTVFRVDRINKIEPTEQIFSVPYVEKFDESEFRKRVQFMFSGELRRVRFIYRGVLEAVLDRLPTASVEKHIEDGAIIRAEAYGNGIDMWLMSQGDKVEIL